MIAGLVLESGKFNWRNGKFPQFEEPYYTLRDKDGRERSILEVFPDFPFTARIRTNFLAYFSASLSPFDAYLVLIGIETLLERVKKQVESAEKIVSYLENNPNVSWVSHHSAKSSPYKALAAKCFPKGAGSVFSFGFKGDDAQKRAGIAPETLRLSIRLEDVTDLIADLDQAFVKVYQ